MLSKINKIATFLILSVSLVSCDQNNSITSFSKLNEKGSIKVNLVNPAKFKTASFNTKYIDPTDVFYGTLSVTGSGIGSPISNSVTPNPIRLQNGSKANADILIDAIPTGNNRIIKVLGLDKSSTSLGAHVQVMGLANVLAGKTVSTEVSWRTTPSAKVIERASKYTIPTQIFSLHVLNEGFLLQKINLYYYYLHIKINQFMYIYIKYIK